MLSLPQPSTEPAPRKRHQVQIYVENLMKRYGPEWGRMSDKLRLHLEYDISRSETQLREVPHPDYNEFAAKLLTVAWRDGIITTDHWLLLKPYMWNGEEWRAFIESVYHELTGDTSFRIDQEKMVAELPFIRARLGYEHSYLKKEKEEVVSPPQPVTRPKPVEHKPVQENDEFGDAAIMLMAALLLKRIAGRLDPKPEVDTSEPINPEQIAHDDQARIDRIAGELLDGIDWAA